MHTESITIDSFQPSVKVHIETGCLFCSAKQLTGFYKKRNTGLKWVNLKKVRWGYQAVYTPYVSSSLEMEFLKIFLLVSLSALEDF